MLLRHGLLRVSPEMLVSLLGLPSGSEIRMVTNMADGSVGFTVEGDWLPDVDYVGFAPDVDAVYTSDYERGVCRGLFRCDEVAVYGPDIPIPPLGKGL